MDAIMVPGNAWVHCIVLQWPLLISEKEDPAMDAIMVPGNAWVYYTVLQCHPGLTQSQMHDIEKIQIKAMKIIRPGLTYWKALEYSDLTNLEERCISLCKSTYQQIKEPDIVIHHLLPPTRESTYNLRIHHQRKPCNTRVKRSDGSFINYAISMFE